MGKKLIAANWKMHLNTSQASVLVHRLQERIKTRANVELVLAPSMLTLQPLSMQIDRRKFKLAAQNGYQVDEGAFTGEVSISMLHDIVHYVIVGHSDRRHKFNEGNKEIAQKVAACYRNEITPILCVGETRAERRAKETKQVIHDQLMVDLKDVTSQDVQDLVIAYEPVWAIGTGEFCKPDSVQQAANYIRGYIKHLFGPKAAKKVRILYGGSVVPDVARSFLEIDGIDGLLVGGASLNYEQFSKIAEVAYKVSEEEEQSNGSS